MGSQMFQLKKDTYPKAALLFIYAFCVLLIALLICTAVCCDDNNLDSFSEPFILLDSGWTLTDSAGNSRQVDFPETVPYGADGRYTFTCTLPVNDGLLVSPALCVYSNYVDVHIFLDGQQIYQFPTEEDGLFYTAGNTGNTYHFVRLPSDYEGKTLTVSVRGQLDDGITYLLRPPLLGSKATMIRADVMKSMPSIILAGCMMMLAIALSVLYMTFRRRLQLGNATVFTALFAVMFACYVYCETLFAQIFVHNGYLLCTCTLLLLALMPIPLIGVFAEELNRRFRMVTGCTMVLCCINLIVQTVLNFTGVRSLRVMLPATHAAIILTMAIVVVCMFLSGGEARRKLLSALPMIAGGAADIVLIMMGRPSFNNSLWFTLGVSMFIILQFSSFVHSYFVMYRAAIENEFLRDMAYKDVLAEVGNRNAYEKKLKELSDDGVFDGLCCIILDINDLKLINDRLGHRAGDIAIMETGRLLREHMPENSSIFRTGGDEFIVFVENAEEACIQRLASQISAEAKNRSQLKGIPLSLGIGCGRYEQCDGALLDFIRRIDALMYENKHLQKTSRFYPFRTEFFGRE